MLDRLIADDEGEALDEPLARDLKDWQPQRGRKLKGRVAQNFERQMEALRHLALIGCRLRAKAENRGAKTGEVFRMVTEPQLCGVQPRAPGMRSQPSGNAMPGAPVMG